MKKKKSTLSIWLRTCTLAFQLIGDYSGHTQENTAKVSGHGEEKRKERVKHRNSQDL